jgi:hypothetical protein
MRRVGILYKRIGYTFVEVRLPKNSVIPLQQFDDFAPDALEVRNAVIAGGFRDEKGPDGAIYTGISQYPVNHWFDRLSHLLGKTITPRLSAFRLNLKGELPHSGYIPTTSARSCQRPLSKYSRAMLRGNGFLGA